MEDQKKLLVISTAKHSSPSFFFFFFLIEVNLSFPNGAVVKNMLANAGDAGDAGSIPVPARYPGEENGNPIQYSCLENSMESHRVG